MNFIYIGLYLQKISVPSILLLLHWQLVPRVNPTVELLFGCFEFDLCLEQKSRRLRLFRCPYKALYRFCESPTRGVNLVCHLFGRGFAHGVSQQCYQCGCRRRQRRRCCSFVSFPEIWLSCSFVFLLLLFQPFRCFSDTSMDGSVGSARD